MENQLELDAAMKMVPLNNRIIVKVDAEETKTAGGIIIPDGAADKPLLGFVVAIGPGSYYRGEYEPMEVEVGMRIAFNKFAGKDITHAGEEYKVMRTDDVEFKLVKK